MKWQQHVQGKLTGGPIHIDCCATRVCTWWRETSSGRGERWRMVVGGRPWTTPRDNPVVSQVIYEATRPPRPVYVKMPCKKCSNSADLWFDDLTPVLDKLAELGVSRVDLTRLRQI